MTRASFDEAYANLQKAGAFYDAWQFTWTEVQALAAKGKILCDAGGWGINLNRISDKELYKKWYDCVNYAMQGNKDVPPHVIVDHANQGAPRKMEIIEPKKTAPNFAWSYSALTQFENCPFAFAQQKYYKTLKFIETEAIRDGNRKHTALELYLKGKGQAESEINAVKPHLKYADAFKAQQAAGAVLHAEREITLTEQLKPTTWFAKDAWFRCKLDVNLLRGAAAFIYDWKTGKMKPDMTQLKISCAALAIVEPTIQTFTAKNIWLKDDKIDSGVVLQRSELRGVWGDILARVARMRAAWDSEVFQKKTSGLCGWCDVTTCPHNTKTRQR